MEKFFKNLKINYKNLKGSLKSAEEKELKLSTEIRKEEKNQASFSKKPSVLPSLDKSRRYASGFFSPAYSKTATAQEISDAVCARLERNNIRF